MLERRNSFLSFIPRSLVRLGALVILAILSVAYQGIAESFQWGKERVTVDVRDWSLERVLREIAAHGGWEIYVEPGVGRTSTAKFRNLTPNDALKQLLDPLNYAVMLPRSGGPKELYVFESVRRAATKRIEPSEPEPKDKASKEETERIPNELVVTLDPDADTSIEAIAEALGAKVVGRIEALSAYRLAFPDEESAEAARSRLKERDDIASIGDNFRLARPPSPEPLRVVGGQSLNLKASGRSDDQLVIGLIDTAVKVEGSQLADFLLPTVRIHEGNGPGDEKPSPGELLSHGTSMAETILQGVALTHTSSEGTPVKILPIDVYGESTKTTLFEVAKGTHTAIREGADIVNLSLGGEGTNPLMQELVKQARQKDVMVVGAAGNQPTTRAVYPAAYGEVLAVTAGDNSGRIAPYANRGDFVDVVGPGSSVIQRQQKAYRVHGTSPATAYISGLAAGMASDGKRSLRKIENILREKLRPELP